MLARSRLASRRSAPLRFASSRSAQLKSAPVSFARRRSAFRKSTVRRSAPVRSIPRKSAPLRSACSRLAPLKFAPAKAGNAVALPDSLLDSARTLTAHIALVSAADYESLSFKAIFVCGLVLFIFAGSNIVFLRLVEKLKK